MKWIFHMAKPGWILAGGCIVLLAPRGALGATVGVDIVNFSFQPATVDIKVGDTVVWTQRDSIGHTTTSDTGLWSSPLLSAGQTFSRTFDTAGVFPYHCTPHPFMRGTVNVQAAANQPPTVSITSPTNGVTVTDPNVTIQATASDPDGSIVRVEFFDGQTSLGTATSAPYQITITLSVGTHTISAQATDNQGATAVSESVSITVSQVPVVTAPILSGMTKTPDGRVQFTVQATAGHTYLIQISTDLRNWETIQTVPAQSDTFMVTDSPPVEALIRFYRVQVQP